MVAGRRVTDDGALEVAKMVYAGQLNVDLLAALREHRVQAVGLSGVDADLITAHRRPPVQVVDDAGVTAKVDYGHVGDIDRVDPRVLRHADGGALRAGRRQPGGRRGRRGVQRQRRHRGRVARRGAPGAEADLPHRRARACCATGTIPSTLVTFADPDDLAGLMASGVLAGGMRPKVEACIRAATGGVERTHIIDGRAPDALLLEVFTGAGCGTMIVGPQGEGDVPGGGSCRLRSTCCSGLVAIPSVSGEEEALARVRRGHGAQLGARACVRDDAGGDGRGARAGRRARRSRWSPTSTSCRRAQGWTRDPFTPTVEGAPALRPRLGRREGLGRGDALRRQGRRRRAAARPRAAARAPGLRRGDQAHHDGARRRGRGRRSTPRSSASPPTSTSPSRSAGS